MNLRTVGGWLALVYTVQVGAAHAAMVSYGFGCISSNVAAACSAGQQQFRVEVTNELNNAALTGQVLFLFHNAGPVASSITDVYFDDGTLLSIAQVLNSSGVSFSPLAAPGNLPGGNALSPAFVTTAGFSADSNAPVQLNGANPGEHVGILFNLLEGKAYADVIDSLNGAVTQAGGAPALRIGVHAQGFADGSSASFVNTPTAVPLPGAAGLLLMGLVAMARGRKRQSHVRTSPQVTPTSSSAMMM